MFVHFAANCELLFFLQQIVLPISPPSRVTYTFHHMWCVLENHGLGWKSKLFSRAKNVKKKWNGSFFWTTSSTSDYSGPVSARDFGFGLFNSLWSVLDDFSLTMAQVKRELFSRAKKVKRVIFGAPSSTSDFLDPIRVRDFGFGLFDTL